MMTIKNRNEIEKMESYKLVSTVPFDKRVVNRLFNAIIRNTKAFPGFYSILGKKFNMIITFETLGLNDINKSSIDVLIWYLITRQSDYNLLNIHNFGPKCLQLVHTVRKFYGETRNPEVIINNINNINKALKSLSEKTKTAIEVVNKNFDALKQEG